MGKKPKLPGLKESNYTTDEILSDHFGVSKATIWRWVKSEDFPKPIKLSPQVTRWRWTEVTAWEASRPRFHSDGLGETA